MPFTTIGPRILACALPLLAAVPLHAQVGTGGLTGVVRDRSGAVVPAAVVGIHTTDGSAHTSTTTDGSGRFRVDALSPGRYVLSATMPGFDVATREVVVTPGAIVNVDMVLEVGRRTATVEVSAPAGSRPLEIVTDPRTPRQPIPAHDGADYLKTIAGFSVIRKGGTDGDPVLRGLAGSRLGILLDGEHILGGCGNRMDPPTAYAFPEAYDRITVLKGPQTVVHGPGNSAGVVLFERDRSPGAREGLRVYASPTFGSFGRNDQAANIKAGGRSAYAEVSATRSGMDDYVDGRGASVHSAYERWSANALAGWTPGTSTRIEVSAAVSDGEASYADRAMDGVAFSRENIGLRLERRNVSRLVQHVEAQAFYNYVDHVMDNFSLRPFAATAMMPNRSVSNPDRRTVGGRVSSILQLTTTTSATVGADWQDNRHTVRGTSNDTVDPFDAKARLRDASFDNLGLFGEIIQPIGEKARIVAGGRADWWTGRDARTTISLGMGMPASANPTAGLERTETLIGGFGRYEQALKPGTTVYVGLGRVSRPPDFWELVSKESAGSISAFGTRPEQTTQLDAGMIFRAGPASGSIAVFANDIRDYILVQSGYVKTSPAMGGMGSMATTRKATISRNVAASMWGGEATMAWAITPALKVDTSLAYTRGQNDTDDLPLAQQPPLEGRVGLQYASARWSLGALTRLVAAQDRYALGQGNIVGQDLGPSSSFAVLSLNATWRAPKLASVSCGVDNLLDATYAEFISRGGANVPGFTTTTRVNEPGRTLWIKLDLRK